MHKTTSISETPLFRGPENDPIPLKEQKKIQIDIRRPIRSSKAVSGPIKRSIKDPQKVTLPRREKEGKKGLFDRDEIKNWRKPLPASSQSMSQQQQPVVVQALRPEPIEHYEKKRVLDDLRDRLDQDTNPRRKSTVHSRLGLRINNQKGSSILGRQELERFRPDVKPWDVNPEFVPRGRNYYEHDTREEGLGFAHSHRGAPSYVKTRDRGKGHVRSRPYDNRNSGNAFRRHRRGPVDTMEWKHDRYPGGKDFHR